MLFLHEQSASPVAALLLNQTKFLFWKPVWGGLSLCPAFGRNTEAGWLEPAGQLWSSSANPGPWQQCRRRSAAFQRGIYSGYVSGQTWACPRGASGALAGTVLGWTGGQRWFTHTDQWISINTVLNGAEWWDTGCYGVKRLELENVYVLREGQTIK